MIKNLFSFVAFASLIFFSSCSEETTINQPPSPSNSANKIMALGASRVEGARPNFESYRFELWKQLVDGGWDFDYIGSENDDAGLYPTYSNTSFDVDHEGRGGFTSTQILEGLPDWMTSIDTPDIVLFSSPGGNDGLTASSYEKAVENINAIIDYIQVVNPNVTIIIEQMAPGKSEIMEGQLQSFFERMQQEVVDIAAQQSNNTSTVIAVDMYTGFNDTHLADDVHYNEAGAKFIADRYYTVLQNVLKK